MLVDSSVVEFFVPDEYLDDLVWKLLGRAVIINYVQKCQVNKDQPVMLKRRGVK